MGHEKSFEKTVRERQADMFCEYDFSKGIRGEWAKRSAEWSIVAVFLPDVANVFRTSESVSEALRTLVRVGQKDCRHACDRDAFSE